MVPALSVHPKFTPSRKISILFAVALSLSALIGVALEKPRAAGATREQTPVPEPSPSPALPKISYGACHVDGPFVAMTFDDGPSAENTPRLLDMLKERDIKATFFMIGENAARYPDIVRRVAAEGHEIGNHSWSHPLLAKMTDAEVREQLQKTQDAISQAGGGVPRLLRPPYGGFTERQRRWANAVFGFKIVFWSVDPLDWKIRNTAHVESEIIKQTKPGAIILAHDIHKTSVDAMPVTLDTLLSEGFKFVTVSQLIAMDRPAAPKPVAEPTSRQSPSPKGASEFPSSTQPSPPPSSP
jgi:peptidoglycan/xylan/chitin deacetylase (PgdA/CDA1 family)